MYTIYPRLRAFGYFGKIPYGGLSFGASAAELAKGAKRRIGALKNLRLLGVAADGSPSDTPALILKYRHVYAAAYNDDSAWTLDVGASGYLENPPTSFRYGINQRASLFHTRGTDTPWGYHGGLIGANQPWVLRFRIPKPPDDAARPVHSFRWHMYMFSIVDGGAEIKRLVQVGSPEAAAAGQTGWTQPAEDAMNALLAQETISDADQTTINNYQRNLYAESESVSFQSVSGEAWYGDTIHTVTFIPEPTGRVHLIYGDADSKDEVVIDNSEALNTRTIDTNEAAGSLFPLWESSPLYVRGSGGAAEWQVGTLSFFSPGVLRFGTFGYTEGIDDLVTSYQADTSTGGTVALAKEDIAGDPMNGSEVLATITKGPDGFTPFAYLFNALLPAVGRDGSTVEFFDTDDYLINSTVPIMDVRPNFDGLNRRLHYDVIFRNPNNTTFDETTQLLQNRLSSLDLNGLAAARSALIYSPSENNRRQALEANSAGGGTYASLPLVDLWARLEEVIIDAYVRLDGKKLGDAIRIVLNLAGVKDSEMTGVSATYGINLPSSSYGEEDAVPVLPGSVAADVVRELIDYYGFAALLYFSPITGSFTLTGPPTAVHSLTTPEGAFECRFSSDPTRNSNTTYVGYKRFAIHSELQADYDISNFFNYFSVSGGVGPDGQLITASWCINNSISDVTGTPPENYLGRLKPYRPVSNAAWRTPSQVQSVLRSLVLRYGQPPLTYTFPSYFHVNLWPGHLIYLDDTTRFFQIQAIGDGSIRDDNSTITARRYLTSIGGLSL